MALTFPFRGPIPDWLDAQTAGHPYWQPSEVPVPTFGRPLLEGASAVFAFASADLRHRFEDATAALQAVGMCPDPDSSVVFELIAYNYREDETFNLHSTPEYKAWRRWYEVLQVIRENGVGARLLDGVLVAFGDLGSPGVHPFWIEPQTWGALKNVPGAPGHFAGGGISFWSVRVVDPREVLAEDKARKDQPKKSTDFAVRKSPPSLAKLTEWYKSRCDAWKAGAPVPSFEDDLREAKAEFGQENRNRLKVLRHDSAPPEWNVKTPGRKKNAQ